jgi:hypothetical protein
MKKWMMAMWKKGRMTDSGFGERERDCDSFALGWDRIVVLELPRESL